MPMTRSLPHLASPRSSLWRCLAAAVLIAVVAAPGTGAAAATKHDVRRATANVKRLLREVRGARTQLARLQQEMQASTVQVNEAADTLDRISAQLLSTQQRLAAAGDRYRRTIGDLNDRAVSAFMGGPAQNFDFLVGSTSLGELSDRMEFIDALAQSDADVAQTVANTRAELQDQQRQLTNLQGQQRATLAKAQAARTAVVANLSQQQTLLHRIDADLSQAEAEKRRVSKSYQAALRAAQNQGYGGSHATVPLPPGYAHVFQACPVGEPRAFTDSFGAPRYGGGYHLHMGNDIVAPEGAPIYAAFDGLATKGYNVLAGNVVAITGRYGTVYNAHLSAYAPASSGPVHAGEVVGYIGMTGDAIGVPHDHFEFHPRVMPSSWPASPYGYSIIEDAVDPYPLLVGVCG
jgi:peptidoglycan hydrolase CwlO-like protein